MIGCRLLVVHKTMHACTLHFNKAPYTMQGHPYCMFDMNAMHQAMQHTLQLLHAYTLRVVQHLQTIMAG